MTFAQYLATTPNQQLTMLPNGIRVLTLQDNNRQSVKVTIMDNSGARHETDAESGISHLIEHMLFKGTTTRSAKQLAGRIEGCGGEINAYTSYETTAFYAIVPYDKLLTTFKTLVDLYYNPAFKPAELAREKKVVQEEINMYQDQPDSVAQDNLFANLFYKHPMGRPVLGTTETLASMTADQLHAYHKSHYTTGATLFVFIGHVDHATSVRLVERATAHLPAVPAPTCRLVTKRTPQRPSISVTRDVQQTQIALAWRVPSYDSPEEFAATVFNCILGGNMSSRLFQNLREKQSLCYTVTSGYWRLMPDCGVQAIVSGCASDRATRAVQSMHDEVRRLQDSLVRPGELRHALEYIVGTRRIRHDKTPITFSLDNLLLRKHPLTFEDMIDKLRAVTLADIQAFAQTLTTPTLSIVAPTNA